MNQRQTGFVIIIFAVILASLVTGIKLRQDALLDKIIEERGGNCFLDDGTCLHNDRDTPLMIIGYVLSSALALVGMYLIFFDRTQKKLTEENKELVDSLKSAAKNQTQKEKFDAFLAGFTDDEKLVLKAIKEQDGITQATLRFRTGMSKAGLSQMLKSMESRELISRKPEGKTNKVFLRKNY
ncbi:MAG: MarR family transcriptional regulator [Nanoarchaeota archaeon]